MRFAYTDDQVALREAVRDLLADACPPSVVRASWTDPSAADGVWRKLADMGLPGTAVSEKLGGLGLSEVDLVPVLEEVGYAAVPLPVAETVAVAAPLLAAVGGDRLRDVLDGSVRVALRTAAGTIPYGDRADLVLDLGDGVARLGPPGGPVEATVDGARSVVRGARPDVLLTGDPDLVAAATGRASLATAAQLVGLSRRMLDLTVAYVRDRHQFGVPVGSFQAVKHRLADAYRRVEFAAPVVLAAAWALSRRHPDAVRDVSAAAVLTTEATREVARAAIQCHGAIGYTVEYDLHLYAKRAWALAATCDLDAHLDRLAGALDLFPEGAHS